MWWQNLKIKHCWYCILTLDVILSHFHPPLFLTTYLPKVHLNVTLPSPYWCSNLTFSKRFFPTRILYGFHVYPVLATSPTCCNLLEFIILTLDDIIMWYPKLLVAFVLNPIFIDTVVLIHSFLTQWDFLWAPCKLLNPWSGGIGPAEIQIASGTDKHTT
jgi:hypothetical protein